MQFGVGVYLAGRRGRGKTLSKTTSTLLGFIGPKGAYIGLEF